MSTTRSFRHLLPWLGWLVAGIASLFQALLQTSPSVMIPGLSKAFAISSFGVSLLSSSFFYTYLFCQIPAGILIDRFEPRRILMASQISLALLCLLFSITTSPWSAAVTRMAMGLFAAPNIIVAFYLAARSLPEKYFALVAGLTEMLCMLGGAASQLILPISLTHFGWRYSMIMLAALAMLVALAAHYLVQNKVDSVPSLPPSQTQKTWQKTFADIRFMLKQSQVWLNGIYAGLLFSLIATFASFWSIPFLKTYYHLQLADIASISAMIFIGAGLGAPFIGSLSTRLGKPRQIMQLCSLLTLLIFLAILYLPITLTMTFMHFLFFALGFFSGAYVVPFSLMQGITPPHMRGTAMAFINMMCIFIGPPFFQPLIGWLLHAEPSLSLSAYQHAFLTLSSGLLLAYLLTFFLDKTPLISAEPVAS
ncbi:MAG: hypothetical protein A3E85_04585 [Gammaproteobacteria bacterium RIFCSPHIGHO2_12_FULL_45_12]|nr:MAG: hypothetical protein A3E85_04585 [Gammaproteobacteria bacterium RIFCSPHIGHO2_12_FULL_45_12]